MSLILRNARARPLSLFATLFVTLIAVSPALTWAESKVATKAITKVETPAAKSETKSDASEKKSPQQGSRRYYLRRGESPMVLAQADYSWSIKGKRYELRTVIETVGVLAALKPTRTAQESRGEVTANGLRPSEFKNEKKRKTDTAKFDWAANTVSYRDTQAPLVAGTQDLLSLYAQLASHLVTRMPTEGGVDIPVASGSKVETYRISAQGDEKITINKREQTALRVYALTDDERIDFWLAKPASGKAAGDFALPLRVRVTEKSGAVYEQSLDAPTNASAP
jgi:hypothetical protein